MSNMHPDWHTTDNSSPQKVSIAQGNHPKADAPNTSMPIAGVHVSRQPAAVLGIMMVIGIGAGFFHGMDNLRGALSTEVTVQVSEAGFQPQTIQVVGGQEIVWFNQAAIPHILRSAALCNIDSACLETDTIFSGNSARYRLPENIPFGTYEYKSMTANIKGIIIVGNGGSGQAPAKPAAPEPTNPIDQVLHNNDDEYVTVDELLSSFVAAEFLSGDTSLRQQPAQQVAVQPPALPQPAPVVPPVVAPTPPPPLSAEALAKVDPPPPAPKQFIAPPGIPRNERTVAWQKRNPIEDIRENVRADIHGGRVAGVSTSNRGSVNRSAQQSFHHAKTGPGIAFAGFGSIAGFFIALRRWSYKAAA